MKELTEFIQSNPDARELKRALAVQMVLHKYTPVRDSRCLAGIRWLHQ